MSKAARNPTGRNFASRCSKVSLSMENMRTVRNREEEIFHFPYYICHLPLGDFIQAMANDKCNMENGKSLPPYFFRYGASGLPQSGGLHSLHVLIHPGDHLPQSVFD